MTIVRRRHPFEGQALQVLGWTHRCSRLHLVLVLPDGTRSLIPAQWTDLRRAPDTQDTETHAATLASFTQLMRARVVADALLRRLEASEHEASIPQEEKVKVQLLLSFVNTPLPPKGAAPV